MAKAASKYVNIHVPREAEDIKEEVYKALEPGYEELLSRYLSKDLEVIQIWQLRALGSNTNSRMNIESLS